MRRELIARPPKQLLKDHLGDVADSAVRIMTECAFLLELVGLESKKLSKAVWLAGFLHDIGKGEKAIQEALYNKEARLPFSHAALSLPFFVLAAKESFGDVFCDKALAAIAFALLSHHSIPHQDLEANLARTLSSPREKIEFDPKIFEILRTKGMQVTESEVLRTLKKWTDANINNAVDFRLTPILRKASKEICHLFSLVYKALSKSDWSSAAGEKFPHMESVFYLRDSANQLVDSKRSQVHSWFAARHAIAQNLLLELPTGFGKTYLGTSYGLKTGRRKIIYTLPVTTIVEDVHQRLSEKLGNEKVRWYTSRYLALKTLDDEFDFQSYQDAKYLDAPIIITTLDQILLAWLGIERYPLKSGSIYDSTIILDEPQLYSPFMLVLFSKLLAEYSSFINLAVMSATIPDFLKKALGDTALEPFRSNVKDFFSNLNRTFIDTSYLKTTVLTGEATLTAEAGDLIKRYISKGAKLAIIVNTVNKAQLLYQMLTEAAVLESLGLGEENVVLLHARYTLRDKRDHLTDLKGKMKKGPLIVISTQLIEAGVDIDFEAMLRELAPLDSLVQSAGRLNRYGKRKVAPLYVFGTEGILPYTAHQIKTTENIIKNFARKPRSGSQSEYTYYEMMKAFWLEIEKWIVKDEVEVDKVVQLRNTLAPFAVRLNESRLNFRQGYASISAVPICFVDQVQTLIKKRKEAKDVQQRKRLTGQIESYMVEVPVFGKTTEGSNFKDHIISLGEDSSFLLALDLKYHPLKGVIPESQPMI